MARIRSQQPVLPSLLDRLIDDDPDQTEDGAQSSPALLQGIRAGVRRDLENLLNTRLYRQSAAIAPYPELTKSVLSYGLPDFSTVQLGSEEHRERLRAMIQNTIERFESRLRRVSVDIVDTGEEQDRTLYLKITALLLVEPDPVPLLFDSRIHALDRMVRLRELRHG
ncbi:MAG: type VI secretion system baseplate subunit TssE [Aquisalimonadaceae bacterium]